MHRQTIVQALAKRSIRVQECNDPEHVACRALTDRSVSLLTLVIARYGHRETAQLLRESNVIVTKAAKARERERVKAHRACVKAGVAFCW